MTTRRAIDLLRGLLLPALVSLAGVGAFLANEWGEGALSEALGVGHRHLHDHPASCPSETGRASGAHGHEDAHARAPFQAHAGASACGAPHGHAHGGAKDG